MNNIFCSPNPDRDRCVVGVLVGVEWLWDCWECPWGLLPGMAVGLLGIAVGIAGVPVGLLGSSYHT